MFPVAFGNTVAKLGTPAIVVRVDLYGRFQCLGSLRPGIPADRAG